MGGGTIEQGRGPDSGQALEALRVAFVMRTDGFPDGMASTNRAKLLATALTDAGADVEVFCTQANEPVGSPRNRLVSGRLGDLRWEYTPGRTTRAGSFLARRFLDLRGFLVLARRLRALSGLPSPIVCYSWITPAWNPAYHSATLMLLRILRIPCVMELNEPAWCFGAGSRGRRREFSTLRGVAGVVVISRALGEWALEEARGRRETVQVLRIPAISSRDMHVEREVDRTVPPRVVLACSPGYQGRIRFLIDAMERVWAVRECELLIAGFDEADPRGAWLQSEPAYTRNRERIVLAGHLDAVALADKLASAAALAAPLDDDERSAMAFPTKVAEYLMTGRPVVTSEVGDAGQLLRESRAAYLAPAGDCEAFADRLLDALEDPEAANETGRRGRELALRDLDAARYGEVLAGFMAEIAREARA